MKRVPANFAGAKAGRPAEHRIGGGQPEAAPPTVHEVLRSPGQPLDAATRALMEPRFGHDFSRVRVHLDSKAAASAHEVGALAYTVGRDIVFARGQLAPHTASGQRLLAHELAHTVQQSLAMPGMTTGMLRVGRRDDPLEREAETVSASALSARAVSLRADDGLTLRRQPAPGGGSPAPSPPQRPPPKAKDGDKAPPPAAAVCKPASDIKPPCSPKGLSNGDFLRVGAPSDAFGFTRIPAKQKFDTPAALTKPVGKSGQVILEKTEATPASCESFFTKAGQFWRVIQVDGDRPKPRGFDENCRGSSYFREYKLTPDGEKKVMQAEQEHCDDIKYAFDISLGCYANVINDLAKRKTQFASADAAEEAVTRRVGRKPDAWAERYVELLGKTTERDRRKWHTAVEPEGPGLELEVEGRGRCRSRFSTEVNENSFPQVGKHPTSEVVK